MLFLTGNVLAGLIGAMILGFAIGWSLRGRLKRDSINTEFKPNTFLSSHDVLKGRASFSNLTTQRPPMTPSEALRAIKEKRAQASLSIEDEGTE